MGTEILCAHFFIEADLLHCAQGLFVNVGKNKCDTLALAFIIKLFKGVHCGCIYCGNTPHSQNKTTCVLFECDIENFISRAEEKGTAYLIYTDIFWYNFQFKTVRVVFVIGIIPTYLIWQKRENCGNKVRTVLCMKISFLIGVLYQQICFPQKPKNRYENFF